MERMLGASATKEACAARVLTDEEVDEMAAETDEEVTVEVDEEEES